MRRETVARAIWIVASLFVLLAVVGLWFDTDSDATVFGKYSVSRLLVRGIILVAGYFLILFLRFLFLGVKRREIPFQRRLLITGVFLLLGIVAAEAGLRWKHHANEEKDAVRRRGRVAGFDPFLQAVPVPNDATLNINHWGWRGEEIEESKPPSTYRIFVIGGSTVFCAKVDFEHSHARVLEKRLREHYPALNIEVQNAGMHWHTSQHSLMKVLFRIQDFDPDLIIVYHAINDLYRSFSPPDYAVGPYRSDYSHYHGPIAPLVRAYLQGQSKPGLLVLDECRSVFQQHWFADFRESSRERDDWHVSEIAVNKWPSLDAFERNMSNLAMVVKSRDVELVMASQPYLYRHDLTESERQTLWLSKRFCRVGPSWVDVASIIKGMDTFNDVSRKIAESQDVLFVDLERVVPKTLDCFLDDVHYTEEGNRIIGNQFAEQIIANGYIAKKFPEAVSAAGGVERP